jgi:hypothetical protein
MYTGKLFDYEPYGLEPEHHRPLKDAFEIRQVGDYGIEIGVSREKTADVLDWAKDFLAAAETFLHQGSRD